MPELVPNTLFLFCFHNFFPPYSETCFIPSTGSCYHCFPLIFLKSCGRKKNAWLFLMTVYSLVCLSSLPVCHIFLYSQVLTVSAWPLVHWSLWVKDLKCLLFPCVFARVCPLQGEWEPGDRAQEMVRLWLTAGEEAEGRLSRSLNVSQFSSNFLWFIEIQVSMLKSEVEFILKLQ